MHTNEMKKYACMYVCIYIYIYLSIAMLLYVGSLDPRAVIGTTSDPKP